jgi:ferredoxin
MSVTVQDIDENTQVAKSTKHKYIVEMRKDICIGATTCVAIAPGTFQMNEDNKAIILEGEWEEDDIIMAAAQSCPVFAIIIKDAETGKQLFPQPE